MPNGFYGSPAEWRELTTALESLDPELEGFASARGLEILRNERAWPNRLLRWEDELQRAIHISLKDEHRRTHSVGVSAAVDRNGHRYWRGVTLREGATVEELVLELRGLLERSYRLVSSWTFDDLVDTGRLG